LYEFKNSERLELLDYRYTDKERKKTEVRNNKELKSLLSQIDGNIAMNLMIAESHPNNQTEKDSSFAQAVRKTCVQR
jgi:hypothetical protein